MTFESKFESNYSFENISRALELYKQGKFKVQVCAEFSITLRTYQRWCDEHEDFAAMDELGQVYSYAWWLQTAIDNLKTDKNVIFNSTLWYMTMRNMHNWGDRPKDRRKKLNLCGTLKEKLVHLETELEKGTLSVDEYQILIDSIYKVAQISEIYEMQPRLEKLVLIQQLKNGEIGQQEFDIRLAELESKLTVLDQVKAVSFSNQSVQARADTKARREKGEKAPKKVSKSDVMERLKIKVEK